MVSLRVEDALLNVPLFFFFFQTLCSEGEMLARRLVVLKGVLDSEEVYLSELETLLMVQVAFTRLE